MLIVKNWIAMFLCDATATGRIVAIVEIKKFYYQTVDGGQNLETNEKKITVKLFLRIWFLGYHLCWNEFAFVRTLLYLFNILVNLLYYSVDTCLDLEGDNSAVLDNNFDTCIDVPLHNEIHGVFKLFSLHVRPECPLNNGYVFMSLFFGNTTFETTCGDKIGFLASNSTLCAGWKICKVKPFKCSNHDVLHYSILNIVDVLKNCTR